ncbi:hypothetical protein [Nocardia harenae]|uniref:hypothetical protein n=1 Tax=Nocardia harenae TaxID=358707 RepID=UPI0008333C12|nr:hypothetical protein [Nocardia harenae]
MLLGGVGPDFAPHARALAARGVALDGVRLIGGAHTARFTCTTDVDMAQLAGMYPGAMARAAEVSVAEPADRHGPPELVVIDANDPAVSGTPPTAAASVFRSPRTRRSGWLSGVPVVTAENRADMA